MTPYFCIVNLPGVPFREIAAVGTLDDAGACEAMRGLAARWPRFETIALYDGERPVSALANPDLGFATPPLEPLDQAA